MRRLVIVSEQRSLRLVVRAWPILLVAMLACASLRTPNDVAIDLYSATWHRDEATGDRLGAAGVFDLVANTLPVGYTLDSCDSDFGSGVRCTFTPRGCVGPSAIMTMYLEAATNPPFRVTAASVTGVFESIDVPSVGNFVTVVSCGLRGESAEQLNAAMTSELYSSELVPWPYGGSLRDAADTALAASRVAINRGDVSEAVARLKRSLGLGQDTTTVVVAAAVEAGAVMRLGIDSVSVITHHRRPGMRVFWRHGAEAYPTDTSRLQRGIQLLDFAALPRPVVSWAALIARNGNRLIAPRTPSIASLDEMDGTAHYALGRAYLERATQAPSCALWERSYTALATATTYLKHLPNVEKADPSDARLASSAEELAQQADAQRRRLCAT